MIAGGSVRARAWTVSSGAVGVPQQQILAGSIVSGTSVDVGALQEAVKDPPLGLTFFTMNANQEKLPILPFRSPSTGHPSQEDGNDVD